MATKTADKPMAEMVSDLDKKGKPGDIWFSGTYFPPKTVGVKEDNAGNKYLVVGIDATDYATDENGNELVWTEMEPHGYKKGALYLHIYADERHAKEVQMLTGITWQEVQNDDKSSYPCLIFNPADEKNPNRAEEVLFRNLKMTSKRDEDGRWQTGVWTNNATDFIPNKDYYSLTAPKTHQNNMSNNPVIGKDGSISLELTCYEKGKKSRRVQAFIPADNQGGQVEFRKALMRYGTNDLIPYSNNVRLIVPKSEIEEKDGKFIVNGRICKNESKPRSIDELLKNSQIKAGRSKEDFSGKAPEPAAPASDEKTGGKPRASEPAKKGQGKPKSQSAEEFAQQFDDDYEPEME